MKKIFLLVAVLSFIAGACDKVELKRETPSSPRESYEELPK
jgi:hypothetical protein